MHWIDLYRLRPPVVSMPAGTHRSADQSLWIVLQIAGRRPALFVSFFFITFLLFDNRLILLFPHYTKVVVRVEHAAVRCALGSRQGRNAVQQLQRLLWRLSKVSRSGSFRPFGHLEATLTLRREYRLLEEMDRGPLVRFFFLVVPWRMKMYEELSTLMLEP